MHQKKTFAKIIVFTALILCVLPFWNSLQDILTRIVMNIGFYRDIQNVVVPYEMKVIGGIIYALNLPIKAGASYFSFTDKTGADQAIYLIWNCVGWQTLVLFLVTAITGFSGRFKNSSKLEALLIGILGTYLINILRILLVIVVYFFAGRGVGIIFHDYFSSFLTFGWLIFFWWFSFKYVLEEKSQNA